MNRLFTLLIFSSLVTTLKSQPTPNFNATVTYGCAPFTAQFTNTTTGNVQSYFWEFGNGNTSSLANPAATYVNPGFYTVKLTASNTSGSNTVVKTAYIQVYANPLVNFSANTTTGCFSLPVTFSNSTIAGSGQVTQSNWDFGDGNTSLNLNTSNTYTFAGNFNVTLVVRDTNGCQGSTVKSNYIQVSQGQNVNFSCSQRLGCKAPFSVSFYDSTAPFNTGYSYLWNFGDGNTSIQRNPTHTYTTSGNYTVSLTVTHPNGCIKTLSRPRYIFIPNLKVDFMKGIPLSCSPFSISFANLTQPDTSIVTYVWDAGNAQQSAQKSPIFAYTNTGNYTIKLIANLLGCSDTAIKTNYLDVQQKPATSFGADTSNYCMAPARVSFFDSTTGATAWNWDFGYGIKSTLKNPVITFNNPGLYDVQLIASNSSGCADTLKRKQYIRIESPIIQDSTKVLKGCKPLSVQFLPVDSNYYPLQNWQWEFPGNQNALTKYGTFTFSDSGAFSARVSAVNALGCRAERNYQVKVGTAPKPKFLLAQNPVCYKDNRIQFVNLTNTSTPQADDYLWQFSDGESTNSFDGEHHFKDTGAFVINLTAFNKGCGAVYTNDTPLIISGPKASFETSKTGCSNDTLTFTNTSSSGHLFYWQFGDGQTASQKSPKHKYSIPGNYNVVFYVTDTLTQCNDIYTSLAHAPSAPDARFVVPEPVGCAPYKTKIMDSTANYIPNESYQYFYECSDGQKFFTANPEITFANKGWYWIHLQVIDRNDCRFHYHLDSAVRVISGSTSIRLNTTGGCLPFTLSVNDSSVADIPFNNKTWLWGNGDSSIKNWNENAAQYTYHHVNDSLITQGLQLKLNIKGPGNCIYSDSQYVFPTRIDASFSYSVAKGCQTDTIYAFSTTDTAIFRNIRYQWFLNGEKKDSTDQGIFLIPVNTASTLVLKISNSLGCEDTAMLHLSPSRLSPKINFGAYPTHINCPGPAVHFNDSSVSGSLPIQSYEWNFGDGSRSVLKNPSKIYLYPGSYPVWLKVTDIIGCSDSATIPVSIKIDGPSAFFNISPRNGCQPLSVQFSATTINANKLEWDLGDGTISKQKNLTHTYINSGRFQPNLVVSDTNTGCKVGFSISDSIKVFSLPVANFISDKTQVCKDGDIIFSDLSLSQTPLVGWNWNFGDGAKDTSNLQGPVTKTYTRNGFYNISLKITDANGCSSTKKVDSLIKVFNDSLPPAASQILFASVSNSRQNTVVFTPNSDIDFYRYEIYKSWDSVGSGPYSHFVKNQMETNWTDANVNNHRFLYQYRIQVRDVCGNYSAPSATYNTIKPKALPAINAIRLNWNANDGQGFETRKYILYRVVDYDTLNVQVIAELPGTIQSFIDNNVSCFKTYFYRIKAVSGNGMGQWSDTSGSQPIYHSDISETHNVFATVVENKAVLISWRARQSVAPVNYHLYRGVDGQKPVFFKELKSDTSFIDNEVDVQRHVYSYITYVKDACGGLSPASNLARTILLKVELKHNGTDYNPVLTWNAYEKWNSGVEHYMIEFYSDSMKMFYQIALNNPEELSFVHELNGNYQEEYCYRVTAQQKDSNWIYSVSNRGCVENEPKLFAPSAFSPNADELNDGFGIQGSGFSKFTLQVISRQGDIVFETNDIRQKWDGTFHGEPVPADTYAYVVTATTVKGKVKTLRGTLTILR